MKAFKILLFLFLLGLIQLALFPLLSFQKIKPNRILTGLLFLMFKSKTFSQNRYFFLILAGLFWDSFSSSFFGLNTLSLLVIFEGLKHLKDKVFNFHQINFFHLSGLVIFTTQGYNLLSIFLNFLFQSNFPFSLNWLGLFLEGIENVLILFGLFGLTKAFKITY